MNSQPQSPSAEPDRCALLVIDGVPDEVVERLAPDFDLHLVRHQRDQDTVVAEAAPRVRGLVTTWQAGFTASLIGKLPRLEMISVYGTGAENMDLGVAHDRGIVVTNTEIDGTDAAVAELAIAFALALSRRLFAADEFVRSGSWVDGPFPPTTEFVGKAAGIVGLGFIGRQIATRAEALGVSVAYHDVAAVRDVEYPYFADLVEMARAVDFLFVSCRGGPETNGIINRPVLDALGPSGHLVHIAQARYYDEADVITALQERRVAGAAIDIFPNEPDVHPELRALDNVILSPHSASTTNELATRRAEIAALNVKMFFSGGPLTSRVA